MISHMIWPVYTKEEDYGSEDFVKYYNRSINWYSFNTILFGMPVCLLILDKFKPRDEANDLDGNFRYLILILFVTHFVQFCFIKQLLKV